MYGILRFGVIFTPEIDPLHLTPLRYASRCR
jgi:hypothetical protein